MQKLADEQEVIGILSDLVMDIYSMESVLLRALKKISKKGPDSSATEIDATRSLIYWVLDDMEATARRALGRIAEGDTLRAQLAVVRRLLRRTPPDTIELRRRLANRALELGHYPFV